MKKLKKFAAIILCIALIFTAVPFSLFTACAATEGYYTYTISNGEATIISCDSSINGDVIIPSELGGCSVTRIDYSSFYGCNSLISVVIPDTVTSIGSAAFHYCSSLKSVTISNSVTSIGSSAFSDCTSLISLDIGNGVTSIGYNAFYNCYSLKKVNITDLAAWCNISFNQYGNPLYYAKSLYIKGIIITDLMIPDNVTSIGKYAFWYCSSLKSVAIPENVTSIGDYAFYHCDSLTSINVSDGVMSIGSYAFDKCTSLKSIVLPDSITSIKYNSFSNTAYYSNGKNWENGVIYISNHFIKAEPTISGHYIIKSGTKTIADQAFSNCVSLTSVTIPDSVTNIGSEAFYMCASLESIIIPNSVINIGSYAFWDCVSLTSVTIPNSVTSINSNTFTGCNLLENVYFKGTVDDWEKVVISNGNDYLKNSNIHCMAYPDLNSDGEVSADDILLLRNAFFTIVDNKLRFDVNGDGAFNVKDLVHLKKTLAS